jgi:GNAT superfamily N-acetyltransferase
VPSPGVACRLGVRIGVSAGRVSYYNSQVEIHPSARKHGIADADIEHAVANAMSIDDQEDETRLYLGPARDAQLLEVVTIVRDDGTELAIHAMRMRPKYRRLLLGD